MKKYEQPTVDILNLRQEDVLTISSVSKQESGIGDVVKFLDLK